MPRTRRQDSRAPNSRVRQLEFGPILPTFRAYQYNIATTVQSGGNGTELQFDLWENGAPNVFQPSLDFVSGDLRAVSCLIPGVYSVYFTTDWASIVAGTNVSLAIADSGTWQAGPAVTYPYIGPLAGFNSSGHYVIQAVRGYPPQWLHEGLPATAAGAPDLPTFSFWAAQDSGGNEDTALSVAEIYYLGALSVDASPLGA